MNWQKTNTGQKVLKQLEQQYLREMFNTFKNNNNIGEYQTMFNEHTTVVEAFRRYVCNIINTLEG